MRTAFYLAFLRLRRAPLRFCLVLLTIIVTVCIALWFAAGYDTLMANADRDATVMTGQCRSAAFSPQDCRKQSGRGASCGIEAGFRGQVSCRVCSRGCESCRKERQGDSPADVWAAPPHSFAGRDGFRGCAA